jgi:hypothetical protein
MARSFIRVAANAREQQTTTIGNFGGVDLSSPTLQINSSRAAESVNFLKEDGINQKRNGLTNIWNYFSLSQNDVKGVFSFTDSSGTKRLIVATGDVLRVVTNFEEGLSYVNGDYSFTTIQNKANTAVAQFSTNEDYISGWVAGSKLYLLYPGGYYVVVYYNANAIGGARLVAESLANNFDLTYKPLTRFGIAAEGSQTTFPLGIAYDDFNLLTMYKKNSFRTGTFSNITSNPYHTSTFHKFSLDSKVSFPDTETMQQSVLNIKYLEANTLRNVGSISNWVSFYLSTIATALGSPIAGSSTTKKSVYTTSSSGRDFLTSDLIFRYQTSTSTFTNYFSTDTFTPGVTVFWDIGTHPYSQFSYPQVATSTNRVVIDVRQAVQNGYLAHQNTTSNGNRLFHVLKGTNGGFNVSISVWTTYQYLSIPVTSSAITMNPVTVSVVTPTEFSAYEVEKELNLTPSFVGSTSATFSTNNGLWIVANLYYGSDSENGYLQIPYNTSGTPLSFLGQNSLTDFYPPILGTSNMELTFPLYVEGYTEKVVKNKFGKLFGYNGAKNRLFLAGNPDQKNVTQRSSPVNFYTQEQGKVTAVDEDLSYFSDLDYNIVGSMDNAISGLEVLSDNKLLILKEDNKEDATIFTVSASVIDATAYDGSRVTALDGTSLKEEIYLADTGNIGDGLASHKLVTTLNGDTLFLSKLGVRGVVAERSLPTAPRSSVSRSSLINKILKENYKFISNSALTVYKGKAYLYLNGTIYVADENYRTENGEYEWWILKGEEITPENGVSFFNNFNIKNFFEHDGELYFYDYGTEGFLSGYNTRFYKFVSNQYVDKKMQQFANGNATYTFSAYTPATNNGVLSINSAITPLVTLDKYIAFRYEQYNFIGHLNSWSGGIGGYYFGVTIDTGNMTEVVVGKKFRVMAAGSTIKGNYYIISEIGSIYNDSGINYRLIKFTDLNGNIVTSTSGWGWGGPTNIATVIPAGTELKIKTIDQVNNEITVFGDYEETLRFTYLNGETPNREFYVVERDNVSCYYITSPFNFGSITLLKTIDKFILSNDSRSDSYIEIEYLAANNTNQFQTVGSVTNSEMFLNDLSFNYLYFGSSILPIPFAIRANRRNIHSIMFKFKNNRDTNACLTNLTMLYYLTKKVR